MTPAGASWCGARVWNERHGAVLDIYDLTHAGNGRVGPDGQFVAGYHADTFGAPSPLPLSPAGARGAREEGGLQLRYGVPAWRISAANVQEVRTWLEGLPGPWVDSTRQLFGKWTAR
jgi:hypothetical protein